MNRAPILLATRSKGKLRELRDLFGRAGWSVVDLAEAGIPELPEEEGIESGDTFEENALAKARYFHERARRPVVADDSGLETVALGGLPGVRSKRWSGRTDLLGQDLDDANNARLLQALRDSEDRRARYVCVAAYVDGRMEVARRGVTEGTILTMPRGHGGFGYDPYFLSSELQETFGEATLEAKERVSHRGRAFRALLSALEERG